MNDGENQMPILPRMKASPEMVRMIRKLPVHMRLQAARRAESVFDDALKTMARWGWREEDHNIEMAIMAAEGELACIVGEA